jgi:hypothetical protein
LRQCWALACTATTLVVGCGTSDEPDTDPDAATRPRLVGRVASVPSHGEFILIQSYGAWSVPPGSPVFGVGADGRVANLLPTGEKMGQFVAADLRDGRLDVGDAVYYRPDGSEPETKPGTTPTPPAGSPGPELTLDPGPLPPAEPPSDPDSAEPPLPR